MDLETLQKECDIEFTRSGGPGGQHRNKASTAVRVTHRPTGIVVVASENRSQYRNRLAALERVAALIEEMAAEERAAEKRRRRKKTRPSKSAVERRIRGKKETGTKKKLRRRIKPHTEGE